MNDQYLQEQHEADPLVVAVLLSVSFEMRLRVVDAGKRHLRAFSLVVRRNDRVRTVYPAIGVQHVLGQVLAVNAIDWIAHVLTSGDDQRERDQQDHGEAVVQAEYGAVYVYVRDLYKALQTAKYVQHLAIKQYNDIEAPIERRFPVQRPQETEIICSERFFLPLFYIFQRFQVFESRFTLQSRFNHVATTFRLSLSLLYFHPRDSVKT